MDYYLVCHEFNFQSFHWETTIDPSENSWWIFIWTKYFALLFFQDIGFRHCRVVSLSVDKSLRNETYTEFNIQNQTFIKVWDARWNKLLNRVYFVLVLNFLYQYKYYCVDVRTNNECDMFWLLDELPFLMNIR